MLRTLLPVLISMPGIEVRTAARILLEVDDGAVFPTRATLPSMPVTRLAGTSGPQERALSAADQCVPNCR